MNNPNPNRCRHLRTKSMFTSSHPDEAFRDKDPEHASPSHFWCNLTQSPVGADDHPVHAGSCLTGRSCFEE
jgi:hypothetical protein